MLELYKEIGESINKRKRILDPNISFNKTKEYHLLIPIVSQNLHINSLLELFMRVNGKVPQEMVMEFKSGQMVPCMKVIGRITRQMGRESLLMLMEMCLTDIGKEIKLMVMGFTST